MPHRCAVKLRGIYDSLKTAERNAADYLLAHPEAIAGRGIVEVARCARCSEATVVRLAQRLGYPGFPELKADFSRPATESPFHAILPGDAPEDVVRKVFANSVQALHDTRASLDLQAYTQAVDAMVGATQLAFFGLGNASSVAREAYQKFLRLGVTTFTAEDPDLQLILVNTQLARGDLVVAISYSGESQPILALARQAQARGVRVLALTNFPRSSLAKLADISLETAVFQEHLYGEVGSKRLAQLCVLESLYVSFMLRLGKRARRSLAASSRALDTNKTRVLTGPARP
jgi:DNA-binding MurR/RpiR family transcriptional regulator